MRSKCPAAAPAEAEVVNVNKVASDAQGSSSNTRRAERDLGLHRAIHAPAGDTHVLAAL